MTQSDYRRQSRTAARTLAHLVGARVQGRTIRHEGDHVATMRLHDTLANAGIEVQYSGDGDAIRLG